MPAVLARPAIPLPAAAQIPAAAEGPFDPPPPVLPETLSVSFNWLDLPAGSFTTKLIGSRVTYTLTPRLFASALLQYNSSTRTIGTNARLRWEYSPGSELFIVLNEERDSDAAPAMPSLQNRSLVVKVNRFLRF